MAWCRGQAVTASAKSPQHRTTPRRIVPGKRSGSVSHRPDAPIDPPGPFRWRPVAGERRSVKSLHRVPVRAVSSLWLRAGKEVSPHHPKG